MDSQQATRLDTPPFSVARFICEGYEQDPFKQMVVGMNEGITYAEAYRRMVALAGFLRREQGVGEGDTVMIAAPNIVAYFVLIGAIQLAGATVALMSPTVERTEFAGIYDRVHPAVAIVSTEAHCRLAAECSPATKVMTATCPVDGVLSVEQTWRGSAAWDGPSFDEDPKFVLFTSGSTGTPKAVQLRGSSFCRHAGELTRALRVKPGEVFFIPVPFAHVYGVVALHTALSHHATVATLVKYRPEQAMSLVTSVQANVYLGVSTMYLRELRENQDGEWDLSCLRAGLVAGATSPLAVFEEYEKRYGAILVNSYGMTETAATLTVAELDDPLRKRAASVGHPIEGAEVRTAPLDADGDGLACPYPAEPEGGWRRGELVCKTPSLADGIIGADGELVQRLDAEGVAPHRRHRLGRCGQLRVGGRPRQGHDHPRRHQHLPRRGGEHLPGPPPGRRVLSCGISRSRSGRAHVPVRHHERGCGPLDVRHEGVRQGQDREVQDPRPGDEDGRVPPFGEW